MEKILKKTNQERDEKELLKGEKKLLTVEDASLYLGFRPGHSERRSGAERFRS